MIKEYETQYEHKDGTQNEWYWASKISIDLNWVGTAYPEGSWTIIEMCGSSRMRILNVPYETFMRDWMDAKRGA